MWHPAPRAGASFGFLARGAGRSSSEFPVIYENSSAAAAPAASASKRRADLSGKQQHLHEFFVVQ